MTRLKGLNGDLLVPTLLKIFLPGMLCLYRVECKSDLIKLCQINVYSTILSRFHASPFLHSTAYGYHVAGTCTHSYIMYGAAKQIP